VIGIGWVYYNIFIITHVMVVLCVLFFFFFFFLFVFLFVCLFVCLLLLLCVYYEGGEFGFGASFDGRSGNCDSSDGGIGATVSG